MVRWRVGFYPTTVLEALLLISVAAFVIESIRLRARPRFPMLIFAPATLFLIAGVISVAVAPDRVKALGLFRAYLVEPIAFFIVVANVTRTRRRALLLLTGFALAGLVAAAANIAVVVQAIRHHAVDLGGNSPAAIYETPNALALFLVPMVGVGVALAIFDRAQALRTAAAVFVGFTLVAIGLSQSRGGYLALLGVAVALAFVHPRRRLLVPAVVIGAAVVALLPPVYARLGHELNFSDPTNTFASRLRLWAATARLLRAHPIFGTGLSGFMAMIGPYRAGQYTETLMYPHNILLNAWTETGLLGLISVVWIYVESGMAAWRGWRRGPRGWTAIQLGIALAIVAMVLHGIVDVPYWKNDLSVEFWALVGISSAGLMWRESWTEVDCLSDVPVVTVLTRMIVGGPSKHVTMVSTRMGDLSGVLLIGRPGPHEGSLAEEAREAGATVITVPGLRRDVAPFDDLRALVWMYLYFRRVSPLVVSTHTAKAGLLGRTAAALAGVPVRIHTFHGHVLRGYFSALPTAALRLMERVLAAISARLIAVSPEIASDLSSMGIGRDKTVVIRLGFDLETIARGSPGRLRSTMGIARDVPLVGIVARLAPVKDHGLFLASAKLILARRGTARFAIVGDGELRDRLREEAARLGVAESVYFTGWRHDLPDVYADLDVVVSSSLEEGTPVAMIEASAAGRPVVSTDVGGVRDVVVDGVTGILVHDRDPANLAAAIERLLEDPTGAREMGAAGRKLVLSRYRVDDLVAATGTLYRTLIAEAAGLPQGDTAALALAGARSSKAS